MVLSTVLLTLALSGKTPPTKRGVEAAELYLDKTSVPSPGTYEPPDPGTGVPQASTGVPSHETSVPPSLGTGVPQGLGGTGVPPGQGTGVPLSPGTGVLLGHDTEVPPSSQGTGVLPGHQPEVPPSPGTEVLGEVGECMEIVHVEGKPVLTFRIDWFQGTFPARYFEKVEKYAKNLFKHGEFKNRGKGTTNFVESWEHPSGMLMGLGHRQYETLDNGDKISYGNYDLAYLELKGEVTNQCKQSKLSKLMRVLGRKCEFKMTRGDLVIDDHSRIINLEVVEELGNKHHYSGFGNTFDAHRKGRKASNGHLLTWGNRGKQGCGKRIAFYDKYKESKGEIDAIRVELSVSQVYAEQVYEQFCNLPFCTWGQIIKGWIAGAIDFIHRRGEKDKDPGRRKRYEFWEKIIGDAAELKVDREYNAKSIETIKEWFFKQVAPSLATLMNALIGAGTCQDFWDFFWILAFDGEERMREKHHYMVQRFLNAART